MSCDTLPGRPIDRQPAADSLPGAKSPVTLIRVRGLGKRYRAPAEHAGQHPRGTLASAVHAALGRMTRRGGGGEADSRDPHAGDFWALRDVDLDVFAGDVLALVGRNGSGKSTLLRMLARVTTPTTGHADVCGRLGALLEVGAGFHHDFSGRENVYLSGAILGMNRREIDERFATIVDFAGVGRFLDMPVKRYSSGMYLRLAFAVAAHLPVDALLLDEALAVKDEEFRERAVARIRELARQGRAVMLVTHEHALVREACTRAVRIENGRLVDQGTPDDVLARLPSSGRAA